MMSIHDGVDPYTSFNADDYEKGTVTLPPLYHHHHHHHHHYHYY